MIIIGGKCLSCATMISLPCPEINGHHATHGWHMQLLCNAFTMDGGKILAIT